MLDRPEKTQRLLKMLELALPFEADLTPETVAVLRQRGYSSALQTRQIVSEVSYAGDEGGIFCHMRPANERGVILAAITHIRVPANLPFAGPVAEYQKHRVKKLKKLYGTY
jgi:hypothetical protein